MTAIGSGEPLTRPQFADSAIVRIACQLLVFVVYPISRGRLALWPSTNPGTDLDVYFDYVRRAASGQTPYVDFSIEYPPAAWFVIRAPGTTDWVTYVHRFAWIAIGFEVAAFGLFLSIARRLAPRQLWLLAATYVVTTTLLREFLTTRLDGGLLFLLMLWAWLMLTSRTGSLDVRRACAYVVLGYATSFKLVPMVLLPFALVHDWRRVRGASRWRLPLLFTIGLATPFMALWPAAGIAPLGFLNYHLARGVEIESIWATLAWPLRWIGQPVSAGHAAHAIELMGPWSSTLAQISTVASLAAVGVCLAAERARPWRGPVIVTGTIGLIAFVSASKVLSPQYFVWMLPLLMLAGADVLSSDRAQWLWCAGLAVVALLTTLIYPRFFVAVLQMEPLGFGLLLARNALLMTLLFGLARTVWKA